MAHPLWLASPLLLPPALPSLFLLPSCTPSCTLSSTTRSSWKACATPPTRRVRTPTTNPPPSQVMSRTSWPSATSTTHRFPSRTLPRHRTKTWMTWHSASCSPRHTEDKPITAIQKACQSVSRHCLLCSIEQGNLREKESIGFGVTRNTYSAHSKFSENTRAEKMVDGSGKPDEHDSSNAKIRTLLEEQRQMIIAEYREKVGHHELQASSCRRRAPTSIRTIMATEIGISWSSSTKSYRNGGIKEIPKFYFRYDRETKAHRGPEHYFGKIRQSTGTAKWSKLYEWF